MVFDLTKRVEIPELSNGPQGFISWESLHLALRRAGVVKIDERMTQVKLDKQGIQFSVEKVMI